MTNVVYATIDDLKDLFTGSVAFPVSKEAEMEKQLVIASEWLRYYFKSVGRDLDKDILNGTCSAILVGNIVANVVKRGFVNSVSTIAPDQDVSQVSQSAGPYSMSYSPSSGSSGFYLRESEKKVLGLLRNTASMIKLY
mgnify:CR=1 FL=1